MKEDPHRRTQESVDPECLGSTKALSVTTAPFLLSLSLSVYLYFPENSQTEGK